MDDASAEQAALAKARAKIAKRITVDDNGCWIYPTDPHHRYGRIMIKGVLDGAHRWSYRAHIGPIGDAHVLHTCDVGTCVNPEHLFLGTHVDNMDDKVAKDRSGIRELRNPSGKLTDEQVREIRAKHERGFPTSWLAADYDVSRATVQAIVTRYTPPKYRQGTYYSRHYADRPNEVAAQ